MRLIEKQMLEAILTKEHFKKDNTEVVIIAGCLIGVYLFGSLIAKKSRGHWKLINHPLVHWNTSTTRSRLNALATIFNDSFMGVSRKKGILYIHYNGEVRPIEGTEKYTFIGK